MLRLQELLEANRNLMTVYVLKDDLKQLWRFTSEEEASVFWDHWHRRAMESGIAPLMAFARRLKGYLHGILNHCRWPLHTGILEGINNRIKVIKRMAYGFRDHQYFFLKIRGGFPRNSWMNHKKTPPIPEGLSHVLKGSSCKLAQSLLYA